MAHEISIVDGVAEAMYAVTPAWHKLGQVVKDAPNSEEAIRLAHLDWQVLQRPLFTVDPANPTTSIAAVDERVANVRSDTGAVLGIVSNRYKPFQNQDAFKFVDGLVQDGIIKYESCGALKGGKIVWLLARMPGATDFITHDDASERYILFYTGHDGSRATTILPTSVRVVCWNTFNPAADAADRAGRMLRITHGKPFDKQLEEARNLLGIASNHLDQYVEASRKLAAVKIDAKGFTAFLDEMVPAPLVGENTPHRKRLRERLSDLYYTDPRQQMPSIKETAWAAVNTVTHYVDHDMKGKGSSAAVKADNTLYSVWLGRGQQFKQLAHKTAEKMFA